MSQIVIKKLISSLKKLKPDPDYPNSDNFKTIDNLLSIVDARQLAMTDKELADLYQLIINFKFDREAPRFARSNYVLNALDNLKPIVMDIQDDYF